MTAHWRTAAAVLLIAASAAGCTSSPKSSKTNPPAGASSGSGSSQSHSQACALLTQQDAAAILGQPVDGGKDEEALHLPYPSCTYGSTGNAISTVSLTIFTGQSSASLLTKYRSQYSGMVDLPGLGDQAISEPDGRLVVGVKGDVGCVVIRVGQVKDPAASTKQLAAVCTKVFASA
jgi:hypothetical protein